MTITNIIDQEKKVKYNNNNIIALKIQNNRSTFHIQENFTAFFTRSNRIADYTVCVFTFII